MPYEHVSAFTTKLKIEFWDMVNMRLCAAVLCPLLNADWCTRMKKYRDLNYFAPDKVRVETELFDSLEIIFARLYSRTDLWNCLSYLLVFR